MIEGILLTLIIVLLIINLIINLVVISSALKIIEILKTPKQTQIKKPEPEHYW